MRHLQTQLEQLDARRFLDNSLDRFVRDLKVQTPPQPDIYAVVERNGETIVLEIELTEYQVDAVDAASGLTGGSVGKRLDTFWQKVQERLRQLLTEKPVEVEVGVTLRDPSRVNSRDANSLAEELVRLARGFAFPPSGVSTLTSFQPEFPLLVEYIATVTLTKVSYYGFLWRCSNASFAFVGVSPKRVASLIRTKSQKTYQWAKNSEKWLLVYASGRSIVSIAGAPPGPDFWMDAELQEAITAADQFDRIYFCDLLCGWHQRLK